MRNLDKVITRCQQKKLDNHEYVFSIFDMTTWVQKCYYIYMSPNFKILTSNNCDRGYAWKTN